MEESFGMLSWEPEGPEVPQMPPFTPQEIAGLMMRDYKNHWFPATRADYFLWGGVALGGSGPLDCHDVEWCSQKVAFWKGNGTPYFRRIWVGEILFHLARCMV